MLQILLCDSLTLLQSIDAQNSENKLPGTSEHMPTHVGLIGGGNISETHARAALANPDVVISAIYGTNMQNVERLAREYGGKAFTDYNAFLAHKPMDLVMIGSPSGLHAQQGIDAAHRGMHVLTEKPIDITAARADELIAAAKAANVKLGVMFQDRVKPDIQRLKRLIDSGALGKILFVDARVKWYRPPDYYGKSKWRGTMKLDGGGALMNQGVHTVDLFLWAVGDVTRVQSRIGNSATQDRVGRHRRRDPRICQRRARHPARDHRSVPRLSAPRRNHRHRRHRDPRARSDHRDRFAQSSCGRTSPRSPERHKSERILSRSDRHPRPPKNPRRLPPRDPHQHQAHLRRPRRPQIRRPHRSHLPRLPQRQRRPSRSSSP